MMMEEKFLKTFDPLFKKSATGKILSWKVWVEVSSTTANHGYFVTVEAGQVGGTLGIKSHDLITEGKNRGRKNETCAKLQALAEARARHEKQLKKGYVDSIEKAQSDEVDDIIEGGWLPMLAEKFNDFKKTVKYPAAATPKLDGLRCIRSEEKFFGRTRKPIKTLDHVGKYLHFWNLHKYPFDGEAYVHAFKNDFEKIVSAVRRGKTESVDRKKIQYNIYDINIPKKPFRERLAILEKIFKDHGDLGPEAVIQLVPTTIVNNEKELMEVYEGYLEAGYEGAMLRSLSGQYVGKRTKDLLKMKVFEDMEFLIVDAIEGGGNLRGHVGAFICQLPAGELNERKYPKRTFKVTPEGKHSLWKSWWENPKMWQGKLLTVRFQGWTNAEGKPRIPKGVRIREDI